MQKTKKDFYPAISNIINNKFNNVENLIHLFKVNKSSDIKILTNNYSELYNSIKTELETLSIMEELILQKYNRNNINNITLDNINGYIYARHTMYRTDRDLKDVRVIIGKFDSIKEKYPDLNHYKELINYPDFYKICHMKISKSMDKLIEKTTFDLNHILDLQTV